MRAMRHILPVFFAVCGVGGGWLAFDKLLLSSIPASIPASTLGLDKAQAAPFEDAGTKGAEKLSTISLDPLTFSTGINALKDGNASAAISARNALPRESEYRLALTYAIANTYLSAIPSSEYAAALRDLKEWPGSETIRYKYERALYREKPSTEAILSAFQSAPPVSNEGKVLLASAKKSLGDKAGARALIMPMWKGSALNGWLENEILEHFNGILTENDHCQRMVYLLYRDRIKQATRFAKLAKAEPLFDAWSAVIRGKKNADTLLETARKVYGKTTPFHFIEILRLRKTDKIEDAAALIEKYTSEEENSLNPGEWWNERRIISRSLFEDGDTQKAYNLAAGHATTKAIDLTDAEFHAGWYALVGLKDGVKAKTHFEALLSAAKSPISRARGYYWLARAEELDAPEKAEAAYRSAARYRGTFYGQLALNHLAEKDDIAAPQLPTTTEREEFENTAPMRAVRIFERFEAKTYSKQLLFAYADRLSSQPLLDWLGTHVSANYDAHTTLLFGKAAYQTGRAPFQLAYPMSAIPPSPDMSKEERALALAIARQESEFNIGAMSPAQARGLMQIMPATAREVANRLDLPYSTERLTSDAAFNALLGVNYAQEQIDRFAGSYILTFAAYNAGQARVREWIARFGDPRGKDLRSVINWIESIPYPETRNYVQRVMENLQSYRMLLGLPNDIAHDLTATR